MRTTFFSSLILSLMILSVSPVFASWNAASLEQYEEHCKKISENYERLKSYSVLIQHSSFQGQNENSPLADQSEGFIKKEGIKFHSYLSGVRSVQNERIRVSVDTSQKILLLSEPEDLTKNEVVTNNWKITRKNIKGCLQKKIQDKTVYRVECISGPVLGIEMIVNASNLIDEITILYRSEYFSEQLNKSVRPMLKIKYSQFTENPRFEKNDFSTEKYITIDKKGQIIPTQEYFSYKLIDTRYSTAQ